MQALSPSTVRPRVLIADDHNIVAAGLRLVLEKSCDVIGSVQDGRQLLIEAPKLKPDVIVLDIGMPFLNGLDAAERLKPLLPGVKFVFLTMMDDQKIATAALNLGAVGCSKQSSLGLMTAVSEVLHGSRT
jgi:DNA-binding NarL/FixJ family response regulator